MKLMPSAPARCGLSIPVGCPSISIVPASGWVRPASTRISVDLPAPLAPTRPCTSPGRIDSETPRSACAPPNDLVTATADTNGTVRDISCDPGASFTRASRRGSLQRVWMLAGECLDGFLGNQHRGHLDSLGLPA